jgi:radical SAM protein with 4Fe4S-binding SPASM domain
MNCLHCGSPHEIVNLNDELSTREVIEAFTQIANEFDMSKFRHINITGGEPFVRKDLGEILQELNKFPFYRNIDIQTNGLFLAKHPEILPTLVDYGVTGIGVSIDGLEPTHDAFRRRIGVFKESVKAAKYSVEAGFVVTTSIVVHSKNLKEIPELYNFINKEIKPRVFRLMFIDPIGRTSFNSEYLLTSENKLNVIRFLQEKYKENCDNYADPKSMMVELGCGGWFGKELEGTFRPFVFHCIAGLNNLGILYDGKVASCSNIPRKFIEGDLRKEKIREIWNSRYQSYRNREWLKNNKCIDCGDWDYCHGGPMHLVHSDKECYLKNKIKHYEPRRQ